MQGLIDALNNDLQRANTAVLRMMNDQYRQTIFKAGMFVSNGVYTEEQAVRKAVEEFAAKGLNCIEYKDGRRVNIADYASMAVRTANQRAYMVGEGEFRKSIGETLVIISRHSTSCDLCKPFEGKVLIDDVYSGGTQEDGDYMLLSEAMAQGLYHPRCRHGLGTYYPELEDINGYETEDNKLNDYGSKGTLLTNGSLTKAINNNRIYSGANYGAYTDLNDPDNSKRDRSAKEYYEQIRSRDRSDEIKAVANNTGFSESDIERVFAHIFEREHLFSDGTIKRFDPDYYMQQSWMRLREGKNIQEHDLTLLKHELAEEEIMGANLDVVYEYAHEEARKSYDYTKELLEYLENHDA